MMPRIRRLGWVVLLWALAISCVDPYSPPKSKSETNFLVVDGFINTTDNVATVKLSRTVKLTDSDLYPKESNAIVFIENSNSDQFQLSETEPGEYSIHQSFSDAVMWRLKVTVTGKDYVSDFITTEKTPVIDSLTWGLNETGINIFVYSDGTESQSRYYQYTYEETYEYTSPFASSYKFINGTPIYRLPEEEINRCFTSVSSNLIILNTTENLQENITSKFPLLHLAKGDKKLWRQYSILVNQKALSKDAYEFWTKLRKTTESLGSLFDPIPFQVTGNIHSITDASEPVLGYFSAGEVSNKRIVIRNKDLPFGFGNTSTNGCTEDFVAVSDLQTLVGKDVILTTALYSGIVVLGYYYSTPACVDCTLAGGTNVKPYFMN